MIRVSPTRILRIIVILLFLLGANRLRIFFRDQDRFQQHLHSRHITWRHFPSVYSNTLRSKDLAGLRRENFDYAHWLPPLPTGNSIPRSIHFIWFKDLYDTRPGGSAIPSNGSNTPAVCQAHNPLYNVTVWDAREGRELIEENYSWFLPTYDGYRYPIQRVDALKYFILWHYGGVYMDLDISCRRPLEPLLQFPAWFPEASPMGVNNDLIASRPRHPILYLMLENLVKRDRTLIFPYLTVFWSTGPRFAGDMLGKWDFEHPLARHSVGLSPDDWFILPRIFYSEEYTFFGHRGGASWHSRDAQAILWLVAHPVLLCVFLLATIAGTFTSLRLWKKRQDSMRLTASRRKEMAP